jgi:flagellar biosynthetic protein FlhB
MAEKDEGQERTEQATARRREEAKNKGQVPRSRDLSTMCLLMATAVGLVAYGGHIGTGLQALFIRRLSIARADVFDTTRMTRDLMGAIVDACWLIAPFLALTAIVAVLAPLLAGGWVFSSKLIAPTWSRLNPLTGLVRLFGVHGFVEALKSLLKFALLAGVCYLVIRRQLPDLLALGQATPHAGLRRSLELMGQALLIFSGVTVLIAAIDVPYQLWSHGRKLKMSRQEIREELRDQEGKPEVKAKIRRMQQEAARRRMMQEVPKADVIVTNPEHYAVALRYDASRMTAPKLVAKGADEMAAKIREVAIAHNVPMLTAPPLARAIYFNTKLNDEIPAGLYLAVAQVLAYVMRLKQRAAHSDDASLHDLPIPEELRRDP